MNKNNNNYLLNFQWIVSVILILFCINSYATTPRDSPLSVLLNSFDSEFTDIGKPTLIPFEMEMYDDWVSATIDFKVISSDREISSHAIKIDPIVLNDQNQYPHLYPQITKTNINMVVNEEGLYEIEGIITVTLSHESKFMLGGIHSSYKISFGVFSFQGKYVYSDSSQAAIKKYAELYVYDNPKDKIKKLINKAKLNIARTGYIGLTQKQYDEISFEIYKERLRIEELYNKKYHAIND